MAGGFGAWKSDGPWGTNLFGVGTQVSYPMSKKAKAAWTPFVSKLELRSKHIGFAITGGIVKELHGEKWSASSVRWEPYTSSLTDYTGCPPLEYSVQSPPENTNNAPREVPPGDIWTAARGALDRVINSVTDPGGYVGALYDGVNRANNLLNNGLNAVHGGLGDLRASMSDRLLPNFRNLLDNYDGVFAPPPGYAPDPEPQTVVILSGESLFPRFDEFEDTVWGGENDDGIPPTGGVGGVEVRVSVDLDSLVDSVNRITNQIGDLISGYNQTQEADEVYRQRRLRFAQRIADSLGDIAKSLDSGAESPPDPETGETTNRVRDAILDKLRDQLGNWLQDQALDAALDILLNPIDGLLKHVIEAIINGMWDSVGAFIKKKFEVEVQDKTPKTEVEYQGLKYADFDDLFQKYLVSSEHSNNPVVGNIADATINYETDVIVLGKGDFFAYD